MLTIRHAQRADAATLKTLIYELAQFEQLTHETTISEADILRHGFGPRPRFRALLAEWDGEVAGYALFVEFFSSFQGQAGLFLEDIFVRTEHRNKGIGMGLFARVAKIACDEHYFCLRWEVLDWNKPAISFYRKLDAEFLDEWKAMWLFGDTLRTAAKKAQP